jgi:thiol-disulfide isomerase/thioredoxin
MNIKNLFYTIFTFLVLIIAACQTTNSTLNSGTWRGALITKSGAEIPFNFELKDSVGKWQMFIKNGKEQFKVDEITRENDSIFIKMPLYDSEIKGVIADNKIEGYWVKHLADKDVKMDFVAQYGITWRFKEKLKPASQDISGKWATIFTNLEGKDSTLAIGNFKQEGNAVSGSFLTPTGDYRYLDGVLDGDELSLSTFDGGFAFLFTAKVNGEIMSDGKFYSGFSSQELFTAKKDENATLPDAYSLTYLKPGFDKVNFSFPDMNKKQVSLTDEEFKNKVVILQLLGSWCPNCMDETAFLSDYIRKNNFDDVKVLGLAYERTTDFEKCKANLQKVIHRFQVPYPFLITGYTNKKGEPAKSLPMLNAVMAFPTMIVIDKQGKVRNIHTGFNGPGTGKYYEDFVKEFDTLISTLRKE